MHDRLIDGRAFRVLTAINQFTRECVALVATSTWRGEDVAAFPGPGSVETVAHDVPGTDSSMDRTYGIGTSAILQFGLALVDERTASLELGLKL